MLPPDQQDADSDVLINKYRLIENFLRRDHPNFKPVFCENKKCFLNDNILLDQLFFRAASGGGGDSPYKCLVTAIKEEYIELVQRDFEILEWETGFTELHQAITENDAERFLVDADIDITLLFQPKYFIMMFIF